MNGTRKHNLRPTPSSEDLLSHGRTKFEDTIEDRLRDPKDGHTRSTGVNFTTSDWSRKGVVWLTLGRSSGDRALLE